MAKFVVYSSRQKGVFSKDLFIKECDCGSNDLFHCKSEDYILCKSCDAVYTLFPKKTKLSESELNYVKGLVNDK